MVAKISSSSLFFVCLLALSIMVHAQLETLLSKQAVVDAVYNYGTDLNHLIEYAVGASCNFSTIDMVGAVAVGTTLVQNRYSANVRQFLVVHQNAGGPTTVVVNFTNGVPTFLGPNRNLFQNLQAFYPLFTTFNSVPFYWQIDKVIVDSINVRDEAYGGATTAYVRASDVNTGYHCAGNGGVRSFSVQQSVYNLVFVLEGQLLGNHPNAAWKILSFTEINKNQFGIGPVLPIQQQPSP